MAACCHLLQVGLQLLCSCCHCHLRSGCTAAVACAGSAAALWLLAGGLCCHRWPVLRSPGGGKRPARQEVGNEEFESTGCWKTLSNCWCCKRCSRNAATKPTARKAQEACLRWAAAAVGGRVERGATQPSRCSTEHHGMRARSGWWQLGRRRRWWGAGVCAQRPKQACGRLLMHAATVGRWGMHRCGGQRQSGKLWCCRRRRPRSCHFGMQERPLSHLVASCMCAA